MVKEGPSGWVISSGLSGSRWDAALIATNLLDENYVARAEGSPGGAVRFRLGDPRQVEFRVAWRW